MDEKLSKYFILTPEKSFIVAPGKYIEIKIPDDYFDSGVSSVVGDTISTFGFLDIYAWDKYSETPKMSDADKILLRIPNIISTRPSRISHDSKNGVKVLEYFEGDSIITTTLVAKDSSIVVKYLWLILGGKIPDDISYPEIIAYFEKTCEMNAVDMKVNALFQDLIVVAVSRDPNNLSRQFREAIKDNPRISMYSRKLVNIDAIPSLTSQFSAISGSNAKYGITSSVGAVRSGDMVLEESDIEKAVQ